ncbi:GNAT family N-acetyltransferase [Clostridium hydrogenum]|uniref:GNAT family N-acetyltransferase n=1 Tax=Clostridium hydrogenum TaxID=2855764 RepID=UPI001F3921D5|nr:N-acetyltransferase [Clostridium hydrogenum]
MIRNMQSKDIDAIKEIDKLCFKTKFARNSIGIEGYLEASNSSSLVYELDNKIIGYNFIHLWGSFAWFGPLGVHPEYKDKGIGKALINHTIKILKEDYKISTIALNTMPESSYNVGFYMSLGFIPLKLTLTLKKELNFYNNLLIPSDYVTSEVTLSNETDYSSLKDNLKTMSNRIFKDFDLTSELCFIKTKEFGTAFELKTNGNIQGIILCYTKPIRGSLSKNMHIKLAIIDGNIDYKKAIDSIIIACSNYAKSIGYESITIDCNTCNTKICNHLISKHAFKIQNPLVMMVMGKDNPFDSKTVLLLTRLAG